MQTLQLGNIIFGKEIATQRQYLAELEKNDTQFLECFAHLKRARPVLAPSESAEDTMSAQNASDSPEMR
jgi:hypothetical protein